MQKQQDDSEETIAFSKNLLAEKKTKYVITFLFLLGCFPCVWKTCYYLNPPLFLWQNCKGEEQETSP